MDAATSSHRADGAPEPGRAYSDVLLSVQKLGVRFPTARGDLQALDDVSIDLRRSRTLAIVGESGSGKSVLSRSILRLLPPQTRVSPTARVIFDGIDLLAQSQAQMQKIRGRRIAMVFQDPMTALNPVRTIGSQLVEGLRLHLGMSSAAAGARGLELLQQVGISSPERRLAQYPHELSGGMRQRVVIAMAIACKPELLIADEPTTALDVTVQAEILELLRSLQHEHRMTMILITHDLGVAAGFADDIAVMYAGQLVERAATHEVFKTPRMPYANALLRSIPRLDDVPHTELYTIAGRPPTTYGDAPAGCRYAARCERRAERCDTETPPLSEGPPGHAFRCWRPLEWS
ncbi:MAG: ABC transporter ATP-binding protein [Comamonadaceae bacterium]|nr:MAG: ABC transporter ATP-binding protein [Comamonadaceae bacterium]